jgi:hypothetical protein
MKLQSQSRSLGASHHLQAWCALVVPHQAPGLELSNANYNRTNHAYTPVRSITDSRVFLITTPPIEFA